MRNRTCAPVLSCVNYKKCSIASSHDMSNFHFLFLSTFQELCRTWKEGSDRLSSGVWPFHLLSQIVVGQSEISNSPMFEQGGIRSYFITKLSGT